MSRITKLIISALLAAIFVAAGILATQQFNKGTLVLSVNPAASYVMIEGKPTSAGNHKLTPGTYTITARLDGYITKTHTVTIARRDSMPLSITLLPVTTKNITEQKVKEYFSKTKYSQQSIESLRIIDSVGFYGNTWIVSTVQTTSDPGTVVLHQDAGTKAYDIVLGPGTAFQQSDLAGLPKDVRDHIRNKLGL